MKAQKVNFLLEKETKNTVRYQEVVGVGNKPAVGTIYVQKNVFVDERDFPNTITVTVEWE